MHSCKIILDIQGLGFGLGDTGAVSCTEGSIGGDMLTVMFGIALQVVWLGGAALGGIMLHSVIRLGALMVSISVWTGISSVLVRWTWHSYRYLNVW